MKHLLHLKMLLFVLLIFPATMVAQQGRVTGTVTEAGSNSPLAGANIIVKGTTNGVITDFDGNYSLNIDAFPATLVVSSVGFNTTEVKVTAAGDVQISLQEGVALDEVVLIGSRNPSRTSVDSAVPVDIIDIAELTAAGPQVNLNQILNFVAPSFTSNTQTISDGTDHIDPASLN